MFESFMYLENSNANLYFTEKLQLDAYVKLCRIITDMMWDIV